MPATHVLVRDATLDETDTRIEAGDLLIVIGRAGSLMELAALARGEKVSPKQRA